MKKFKQITTSICLATILTLSPVTSTLGINNTVVTQAATIKLNKKSATLKVKQKITLKLTGAKSKVKWTSSNKSVATVSSSGVVTAKKKGTATITATYNKKKYTCKITVKASSNTSKPVTVKLNKKSATLKVKQKITLKLTGAKSKVKWTSSNKSVATVSSSGVVTAKKKGTATITATYNKKKYTCKITVKASSNTSKPNQSQLLDVKLTFFDAPLVAFNIKNTSSKPVTINPYMLVTDDYDTYLLELIDEDSLESISKLTIAPNKASIVYFAVTDNNAVFISDSHLFFTFNFNNAEYGCLLTGSGNVLDISKTQN